MRKMTMMKMMMMKKMMMIVLMNVRNSLMIDRRNIEIFESMFDLLRFESNEIREVRCFEKFSDLMMIEEIDIEHREIVSLVNECIR